MKECMETDKKIQVLLSTYNGARYLPEQLDSITQQTIFNQVSVLIRDDGSSDTTADILHEYSERFGFEVIYGDRLGVTESMWELLRRSDNTSDYFAFCDQDDVWLPHKLEAACKALDGRETNIPLLYASKSRIVDEALNYLGSSTGVRRGVSYYNAMVQNVTPGHTQVFNRALRDSLMEKGSDGIHVIDWWLYLVASGIGKVIFNEEETVLHRQHGKNAVGFETTVIKKILRRMRFVRSGKGNAISLQIKAFYRRYADLIPEEYRAETESYLSNLNSFFNRFRYISSCRVYRQERIEDFIFKCLYLLGKYKLNEGD